jgi:hypothetical protein
LLNEIIRSLSLKLLKNIREAGILNHKKLIPQTIEEHKRSWDIILTPSEYKELDKYHTYEPDNEKILIGLFIFIIALILLLIIGINRS